MNTQKITKKQRRQAVKEVREALDAYKQLLDPATERRVTEIAGVSGPEVLRMRWAERLRRAAIRLTELEERY